MCESSKLNLFNCKVVQDLINFKWTRFGKRWHLIGCFFHFFLLTILIFYINIVYIKFWVFKNMIDYKPDPFDPECGETFNRNDVDSYSILLVIGIMCSNVYYMTQVYKVGIRAYISDGWNLLDTLYILTGIT